MSVPESNHSSRRLLGASLLAGVLVALAFVTLSVSRLSLTGRATGGVGDIIYVVVSGWILQTAAVVPLLLAILLIVAVPSRKTVASGAIFVYVTDLLLVVVQTIQSGFPARIELTILAVPLTGVVTVLAVATAVWLATQGGYERLVSALGNPDQHPLFANVADERIGPALSLQRGIVAAGIAAIVAAGGLVVAGGIGEVLGTIARLGTTSSPTVGFAQAEIWSVGIPLAQLSERWLFEASFLLAVLFVVGPRLWPRDLVKGIVVIFGVRWAVTLLTALVPPFRPIHYWGPSGPVLPPLSDAMLLLGVAIAVWLAFHGGSETLQSRTRLRQHAD